MLSMQVAVRSYELDALGHVNHVAYHQWGEHARFEFFREAGCSFEQLWQRGISPVMLDSHIRFLHELRAGAEVEVTTGIAFGQGKTFRMHQQVLCPDGTVSADIDSTMGVFDLQARRLLPEPHGQLAGICTRPELLAEPARAG